MIPSTHRPFGGIYVAMLTPFRPDGSLDEAVLAAHVQAVTAEAGIVGVLCNGHAGESFLLSREERRRVVEITAGTVGRSHMVVSGVLAEASEEAASHARDARAAGADAVLVFPPFSWALSQDDAMAVTHHEHVAAAADLPVMLYQAGVGSAMAYRPEVLARLVQMPDVVAIKEGSWESAAYDRNRQLVQEIAPHVAMLASGDEHLLSCFALGSEGSIVSLAALMPAEIVALDRAVARGDLTAARALHARIQPLATAIYGLAPTGHATARLKACMVLLGRWSNGFTRPPITGVTPVDTLLLGEALTQAGLMARAG